VELWKRVTRNKQCLLVKKMLLHMSALSCSALPAAKKTLFHLSNIAEYWQKTNC